MGPNTKVYVQPTHARCWRGSPGMQRAVGRECSFRLLAALGAAFELTLGTDEQQSPERGPHALLVADAKPQARGSQASRF